MLYKYITENNLEHCQNYMYSEYSGIEFLTAYLKSRQAVIDKFDYDGNILINSLSEKLTENQESYAALCELYDRIIKSESSVDDESKGKIDFYIKVFELRKRIYNKYKDGSYRPEEESGYENYGVYVVFALSLSLMYERTNSIRYLNTLLKLNDVLISLIEQIKPAEVNFVVYVIQNEMKFMREIMAREDIVL